MLELEYESIFNKIGATCPITIKENVRALLKSESIGGIARTKLGNLGMHSLSKYGTTTGSGNRCSKDKVDLHSRWKFDK